MAISRHLIFLISSSDIVNVFSPSKRIRPSVTEPLGGSKPIKIDVRLVAATNADLPQRMQEGRFREDLYYRINVMSLELPPIRRREEDIPLLVARNLE